MQDIYTTYRENRQEAKLRGIMGHSIIGYVDGVKYLHKSNDNRHIISGLLHDWDAKTEILSL